MAFFGFLSMLGSVLGGIVLVIGFVTAKGAPQEAAVAALAVALAVLPYVFFRAIQLSAQTKMQREFHEDVLRRIGEMINK